MKPSLEGPSITLKLCLQYYLIFSLPEYTSPSVTGCFHRQKQPVTLREGQRSGQILEVAEKGRGSAPTLWRQPGQLPPALSRTAHNCSSTPLVGPEPLA